MDKSLLSKEEEEDNHHHEPLLPPPSKNPLESSPLSQRPMSSTTTPQASLPVLPHLVLRRIASFLTEDIPTLFSLASTTPTLKSICKFPISSSCHRILRSGFHPNTFQKPASHHYLYHDIIFMILNGYLDPEYITDFFFDAQGNRPPPTTSTPGYCLEKSSTTTRRGFFEQVEGIVRSSPWIPDARKEGEVLASFRAGGRDAAVMVLLHLCPRLRTLDAPVVGMPFCAEFFRCVTGEYQRRGTDPRIVRERALEVARRERGWCKGRKRGVVVGVGEEEEESVLPFSQLLVLQTRMEESGLGPKLVDTLPFLGIPSLQRIILQGVREREVKHFPGWPLPSSSPSYVDTNTSSSSPPAPRPSAPEIYFQQSSASQEVVRIFAQGLFPGGYSYEIRQWFEAPIECWGGGGGDFPEHADWDRVVVDSEGDIEIGLVDDGGNPGSEFGWVSWLYHEKMRDWRRFGEECRVEEGDGENEEINGCLGRF